ncbi:Appr-1-p processing enzyme family protein [Tanacetum coccineum]
MADVVATKGNEFEAYFLECAFAYGDVYFHILTTCREGFFYSIVILCILFLYEIHCSKNWCTRFEFPASHVNQAVGPDYDDNSNVSSLLSDAYRNSPRVARENNINYVSFCGISCVYLRDTTIVYTALPLLKAAYFDPKVDKAESPREAYSVELATWKLQLSIDICALTMLACNCKHGGVQEQAAPAVFASALLRAIFFLERNWISLCNDYKDTTLANTKDEARLNPIHHHMIIIKATPLLRLLCTVVIMKLINIVNLSNSSYKQRNLARPKYGVWENHTLACDSANKHFLNTIVYDVVDEQGDEVGNFKKQTFKLKSWKCLNSFQMNYLDLDMRHYLQCPQGLLGKHFEKLIHGISIG